MDDPAVLRALHRVAPDSHVWTQRVGALSGLPALIRELGVNPGAMLADAGLAPGALDDPDGRLPYLLLARLVHRAAGRTGCAHFGLLAGRMCRLGDLGIVGELTRHSRTVGDALRTFVVHQHLNSEGGLTFLIERGGLVDFGYAIYHPGIGRSDEVYDMVLAATFNLLRELCGPGFVPTDVLIPHAQPLDPRPYRALFKARVQFDAEVGAVRFPESWMQRPVEGCDPQRRRDAQAHVDAMMGHGQLLEQVHRALRRMLVHGRCSGDEVASMLAMHRRTLNRRLHAHGTTFQQILDKVRFDIARQLLEDSNIALDDIAATLGYGGVSPFMRTFRRWTGTTPTQWRLATIEGAHPHGEPCVTRSGARSPCPRS